MDASSPSGHGPHQVALRGESLILFRAVWDEDAAALFADIESQVFRNATLRQTLFDDARKIHGRHGKPAARLAVPAPFSRRLSLMAAAEGQAADASCFIEACIERLARRQID